MGRLLAAVLLVWWCALVGGCAAGGADAGRSASYTLVYLKTGPHSAEQSPEQRQKVFEGHMANMRRLADAGTLIVAGPFDHPHDRSWRGIFVFDVADLARARELVSTDPGVQAGVFTPELVVMRASPALRATVQLERDLRARPAPPPAADGTPPNIREYVMISAADGSIADRALGEPDLRARVVWSGRLVSDRGNGGGVYVLNVKSPEEAKELLGKREEALGGCSIDGWWSTVSLERLPALASGLGPR